MEDNNYEAEIITLTDEDGSEIDFEIIGQYEMNGVVYIALLPVEEEEKDGSTWEYIVLKLAKDGDEEMLVTVDDDDEFEAVAAYFDDLFSSEIDYD